ncbi:MAG: DUF456 domain-containing protein [Paludibacter sp.]|nr:DUF456 domain-containing protein [Paludibacter sp.]
MDIFLIIVAGIFLIAGLLGCLISKLPGIVLSYLGIIILNFSSIAEYSVHFFIRWGVIIIAIQGLDYIIPNWGDRKFGGSKTGVWGSLLGMLTGMYFGSYGVIVGAVIGAFIGELFAGKESNEAIHHAISSFSFFILGTISQLIVAGILLNHYIDKIIYSM